MRWYLGHERLILGWAALLAIVVVWQIGSDAGWINKFFFSSPLEVLKAGQSMVYEEGFWNHFRISATEVAVGGFLAVGLAVPAGLAIGWYTRVGYLFDPWLNFFNATPRIALMPLVAMWVGLGIEMKIVMVFLGAFFAIIIPTAHGVRTASPQLIDAAHSFGASQRRIFTSVVLPGTLPFIIGGLRLAIPRALIGVIIGEFYAQTEGLGVIIARASMTLNADRMLFGVLIFTAGGIVGTLLLNRILRYLQRWRPPSKDGVDWQ